MSHPVKARRSDSSAGLHHTAAPTHPRRWLEAALAALLVITFATGGGAQDHGLGDALAQLLALPVLIAAILALTTKPATWLRAVAIGIAVLIAALPAVQLLALPESWWSGSLGRKALFADLRAAGVTPTLSWTLTPSATERALWSQLPALAAFFGALALNARARLRMAGLLLGLITAGLMLGALQMLAGQESVLNPFPQWVPVIGGVFANPNHQASALVIGAALGTALWLELRRQARRGSGWGQWATAACAALCLAALPLTDSRAGLLLAGPAVVGVLVCAGAFRWKKASRRGFPRLLVALGAGIVLLCGGWAVHLLQRTVDTEARWPMASATATLARDAWPLGTGVGSFPPWFEQAGPDALLSLEFINHAHNEYVQWWLEGGLIALTLLAAALAVLARVVLLLLKRPTGPVNHAAWIGVAVLLASSVVDYPLRTAALMTIGAFLAGAAIARGARIDPKGGRA